MESVLSRVLHSGSSNSGFFPPHPCYSRYSSVVHAALEDGIPITNPAFYADEARCPDSLITHIFRPAAQSTECIPLLHERIRILREVGSILCSVRSFATSLARTNTYVFPAQRYGGSFYGFIEAFRRRYDSRGSALQLVEMVADAFPSFRDEHIYNRQRGVSCRESDEGAVLIVLSCSVHLEAHADPRR